MVFTSLIIFFVFNCWFYCSRKPITNCALSRLAWSSLIFSFLLMINALVILSSYSSSRSINWNSCSVSCLSFRSWTIRSLPLSTYFADEEGMVPFTPSEANNCMWPLWYVLGNGSTSVTLAQVASMSLSLLNASVSCWGDGEGLRKGEEVDSTWGECIWLGDDVWAAGWDGEVDMGGWDDFWARIVNYG